MEIDNKKVLISAIIVALVVLVSFNFEKMTGQTIAKDDCPSNAREIEAPSSVSHGSSFKITVTPKTGTMNLGGGEEEQLWIKGTGETGYTTELSNYKCISGYTNKCKKATSRTSIPIEDTYIISIEKSIKEGRCILLREPITVN